MHPEDYDEESIVFARIPRRISGKIRFGQGWGINLVEGFLPDRVLGVIGALLILSLIFAIVWAVVRDDVQGGFGGACYILGIAGVLVAWFQCFVG